MDARGVTEIFASAAEDEGYAYGPAFLHRPTPEQSASARLHPRAIGMGGASLRRAGGGGDKAAAVHPTLPCQTS